jgi:hypothetical protein
MKDKKENPLYDEIYMTIFEDNSNCLCFEILRPLKSRVFAMLRL